MEVDATGIYLKPWFSRNAITVPWTNVQFVHTVPFVKSTEDGWKTFDGNDINNESLSRGLRFYTLEPALKDRHAVLGECSFLIRLWLRVSLLLKPLYRANGQPDPAQGCLKLSLSRRGIRKSPAALIDTLNLIQDVSRFDLLVTED